MDSPKRSLVKTLTWRVIAILITMIAVYLYSKDMRESIVVSLMANGVKMGLYYLHERLWNHIHFGRSQPDYEI
jgi:uncharacterized membrane protein